MAEDPPIPFKEGQLVETKSFLKGYRGAWFRCKIAEISSRSNRAGHVLEHLDFPGEPKKWVASYQVPPNPTDGSKKKRKRVSCSEKGVETEKQLVLRPSYPPMYRKDELIPTSARSNPIVVIEGHWCVGDLVDMLYDGAYWCGKVTQVDEEEVMVELLPPPMGEGSLYKASTVDLRPTLLWSQESGWTVPTPEGVADFHQHIQIMSLEKQPADLPASEENLRCETVTEVVANTSGKTKTPEKQPADLPASEENLCCETVTEVVANTSGKTKTPEKQPVDLPASEEHLHCETVTEVVANTSEKTKTPENAEHRFMSDKVHTVEAVVIDLEEVANKLTRLRQILKHGYPLPEASLNSWEFVEHRP